MGIAKKASNAFIVFRYARKGYRYYRYIRDAIDEDTRPGALMKLGLRGMMDIAGKAFGRSLTSHPYFTYHKAHLEALAQALNATSNHHKALEHLSAAVSAADGAAALTGQLRTLKHRKDALGFMYAMSLAGPMDLLATYRTNPQSARQIQEASHTPDSLSKQTEQILYEWQAMMCELVIDAAELFAMAHVELRGAEAAMKNYNDKMAAMSKGGNLGRVAGMSVEQERQWREYERMVNPTLGNEKAVSDPTGYAKDQVDSIVKMAEMLEDCRDAAMSDDVRKPAVIALRFAG